MELRQLEIYIVQVNSQDDSRCYAFEHYEQAEVFRDLQTEESFIFTSQISLSVEQETREYAIMPMRLENDLCVTLPTFFVHAESASEALKVANDLLGDGVQIYIDSRSKPINNG